MEEFVYLKEFVEQMDLVCFTPEIDYSKKKVTEPDVNRPGLQLTGFFDDFDLGRIQCIGQVEKSYIDYLSDEEKGARFDALLSYPIPAMVLCRGLEPGNILKKIALKHNVPIFGTNKATSSFTAESIRWLNVKLAPYMSVHGVLVDVYGEGVLITGESGIGKSETALELIKRGHRLVSDDMVVIHRVSDKKLVGSAPDITKYFIELRGIGIVDVKSMFGVSSVKDTQSIDLSHPGGSGPDFRCGKKAPESRGRSTRLPGAHQVPLQRGGCGGRARTRCCGRGRSERDGRTGSQARPQSQPQPPQPS